MAPPRNLVATVLVLLALGILPGCAVSPPDWAWYDAHRHPLGAYPSHAGYYAGAYGLYPATVVLVLAFEADHGEDDPHIPDPEKGKIGAGICGVLVGWVVGAPFHLLCLCMPHPDEEPDDEFSPDEDGWTSSAGADR